MLKKTVRYTNPFTDEIIEKEFYFHLNKDEVMELEVSYENGTAEHLQKLIATNNRKELYSFLKNLILSSYTVREGDQPIKSKALQDEFAQTGFFSEFIFELTTNEDMASEFINSIMPKNFDQELKAIQARQEAKEAQKAEPNLQEAAQEKVREQAKLAKET